MRASKAIAIDQKIHSFLEGIDLMPDKRNSNGRRPTYGCGMSMILSQPRHMEIIYGHENIF